MLLTSLRLAVRRAQIQPFYKRIFTESLFDKMYKTAVTVLIGGAFYMSSFIILNTILYYKVIKPIREVDRERIEKDLIEAEEAGFSLNV